MGKLKRLLRAASYGGVINNVLAAGFAPYNGEEISFFTVFKGKERHTRSKKMEDGTRVKLQFYTRCEGAEDKIFIAVSRDGAEKRKCRTHISCAVYVK